MSMLVILVVVYFAAFSTPARAQALLDSADNSGASTGSSVSRSVATPQPDFAYVRPTETTKKHNYFFDAFGPYPIVSAVIVGGVDQIQNTPPEWKQGLDGYSKRFGSNLGIVAVTATTRYGLSEAFHEDTLYYRCQCRGVFRRMTHAVISTFTARRSDDGHRVFSIPDLVAPYAGTMSAVYAWYPGRYDYKDAFRMGNYSLLWYMGANLGLEFLYSGPHSWISRMHLNNSHGASGSSANPSPKNP